MSQSTLPTRVWYACFWQEGSFAQGPRCFYRCLKGFQHPEEIPAEAYAYTLVQGGARPKGASPFETPHNITYRSETFYVGKVWASEEYTRCLPDDPNLPRRLKWLAQDPENRQLVKTNYDGVMGVESPDKIVDVPQAALAIAV